MTDILKDLKDFSERVTPFLDMVHSLSAAKLEEIKQLQETFDLKTLEECHSIVIKLERSSADCWHTCYDLEFLLRGLVSRKKFESKAATAVASTGTKATGLENLSENEQKLLMEKLMQRFAKPQSGINGNQIPSK